MDDLEFKQLFSNMDSSEKGIEYKPDLNYELDEIPPLNYTRSTIKPQNYTGADYALDEIEDTKILIDYLLDKAEGKLDKYEGFEDFKNALIKKYYCEIPLNEKEQEAIQKFNVYIKTLETDIDKIEIEESTKHDDAIAVDGYQRLIQLAADINLDITEMLNLKEQEKKILKMYIDKLSKYAEDPYNVSNIPSFDELTNDSGEINHQLALFKLNGMVDRLEAKIEELKLKRKVAIENDNPDQAEYYHNKQKKAQADISETLNGVSFLASQGYIYHQKAENTNNYLMKLGYRLIASPFDRLNDSICCLIRLFLRRIDVEELDMNGLEALQFADELIGDLNIEELRKSVDALRAIIYMAYNGYTIEMDKVNDKISKMLMSPVRKVLTEVLDQLRDIQSDVIAEVEEFFDKFIHTDMENPESILDCVSFESFADFIYDEIDKFFEEIESKIIDLYKFVKERSNNLLDDITLMAQMDTLRQIYKLLSDLSAVLKTLDDFVLTEYIEHWIEKFLVMSGFGETYNHVTNMFERIDIEGCLSKGQDDGNYREFLDNQPSYDIFISIDFEEYLKDYEPNEYDCEVYYENVAEDVKKEDNDINQFINYG